MTEMWLCGRYEVPARLVLEMEKLRWEITLAGCDWLTHRSSPTPLRAFTYMEAFLISLSPYPSPRMLRLPAIDFLIRSLPLRELFCFIPRPNPLLKVLV